jgi:predicted outer membrane repeat protein
MNNNSKHTSPACAVNRRIATRRSRLAWRVFSGLLGAALSLSTAQANTITVSLVCTLSAAIRTANTGDAETGCITGAPGAPDSIALSNSEYSYTAADADATMVDGPNALPSVTSEITIEGNGATIIRANNAGSEFRLFHVADTGKLTLKDTILTGGVASGQSNLGLAGFGGAILSLGELHLENVTIQMNTAQRGGGIYATSVLSINDSELSGNHAENGGGAIAIRSYPFDISNSVNNSVFSENTTSGAGGGIEILSALMTISDSMVSGNSAVSGGGIFSEGESFTLERTTVSGNTTGGGGYGGGIYANSNITVQDSTISNNQAQRGGGLALNWATFSYVNNSTLSGNLAPQGAGIFIKIGTNLRLFNSTISNNTANLPDGGGGLENASTTSVVTSNNSIIANNQGMADCKLAVVSSVYEPAGIPNWFGDASCTGTANGDPLFGHLTDNGGPTQTQALLTASPAIDAGDSVICAGDKVNGIDQRGITRPQGAACDLGAFERSPADNDKEGGFFVLPSKNGKLVVIPL